MKFSERFRKRILVKCRAEYRIQSIRTPEGGSIELVLLGKRREPKKISKHDDLALLLHDMIGPNDSWRTPSSGSRLLFSVTADKCINQSGSSIRLGIVKR
jgi:hypothetical protein